MLQENENSKPVAGLARVQATAQTAPKSGDSGYFARPGMIHRFFLFVASVSICTIATSSMNRCSAQVGMIDVREGTGIPAEVYTIYEKGANFLAATQRDDGTWGVGVQRHGNEVNGIASLCVMAFLSTGEDPNFGKYAKNIRKALRHIIEDQDPKTGYIQGNMYVHGFAMLALSECYGAVDDELLWSGVKDNKKKRTVAEALELAVRLTVTAQKTNLVGGWRYSPNNKDADTSITGAVLMGLLAARNAGIAVPDETIDKGIDYMRSMTSDTSGVVAYTGKFGANLSQARSTIACLIYAVGKRAETKEFQATKDHVVAHCMKQDSWPFYLRYYQAQALFQADYTTWQKWNRDTIRKSREIQTADGQIGKSEHGAAYSTSMALLALALNFKFLPIYER